MSTGDSALAPSGKRFLKWIWVVFLLCCITPVYAIDNPDAPDHVGEFLKRAKLFEQGIEQSTHTTQSYITAYADYERFLNDELAVAYEQLMVHLNDDVRSTLQAAQQQWQRYREQEFEFISSNWNTQNFGSSSIISRGNYRTTIIKDRIILLLQYLQNY